MSNFEEDMSDWTELEALGETMRDTLSEMKRLIRKLDKSPSRIHYERARMYWLGHTELGLEDTSGSGYTFPETLRALEPEEPSEEEGNQ